MVLNGSLDVVFYPRSVVLIGASSEASNYIDTISSSRLGDRFYLVNPAHGEVLGFKCYPSILDVPEPVDYAIIP